MGIISVQGANWGVGSSTIAANLAAAHTDLHQRVLIIEADSRNLMGMWFGRHEHPDIGWAPHYAVNQRWQEGLYKSPLGTYFLPFGTAALSSLELLNALQSMLVTARERFEHTIVLLPNQFDGKQLAHLVDLPLVVVNPSPGTVTLLARQLVEQQYATRTRYVLNMCRYNARIARELTLILEDMLGSKLLSSYVCFDLALQESVAALSNILAKAPKSQSCGEFRQLASLTLSQLEQLNQA
ncbi:hypothetical protein HGP28_03145 [Vibrio sp. SM6]|uniref:Cellulose synthase operon protein YhjQ n=1 Tax=Vibrio agarilyticus TaxID=2726741 RepID=A0A7X8YG13_9VIBR|nr:cellulose synthase operon protein YhjQ/BcsQ [Vibrio agarilyticus]NLS11887.1 hypothetical protein [Vibrio agarilyticus]